MKKILVIDDDAQFRTAVMTALQRNEYDVVGAADGIEGMTQTLAHLPDLILCDVNMAGRNGFELLKDLHARVETSAIPVIMMTGEPQKADARFSMEHGADDYLPKPFAIEKMLAAVVGRLQRQDGIYRAVDAQNHTERVSTAEKLHLQASALEASANGIVITDRTGHILWVNPAFAKLTGYTAEQAIGQNTNILKSSHQSPKFYQAMWSKINAGEVWHGELVNRRQDGSIYYEEMTITPVCNSAGKIQNFIAIKQDVSERKKIELTLAQERDLLQALMDHQPDHIYFKDCDSRFTRINRSLAKHLGLAEPEEAVGKTEEDYLPLHDARKKLADERRMMSTGQAIIDQIEKSATARGTKWLSSTKVPIYGEDSKISGLVGISHDITDRQRTENELQWKTAFLEAQVNASIDGILVVDEHGRKMLQNQRLIDMFQIPPTVAEDEDDAKQRNWIAQQVVNPAEFLERITHLNSHRNEISRDEIKLKDGTILDRYAAPVLGRHGKYYGRMWTFRDITERRQDELSHPQTSLL